MIESHTIPVTKTAHYSTIGKPGEHIRYFWLACHGQGQLAKYFIRKFDIIASEDTFILAPEGLSRYYTEGLSGKVGAIWMTKEDRLLEIEDYSNYLSTLYQYYISQLPHDVKIILFGFSQGCATQLRWMLRDFPRFDSLILWAGSIPDDLDYLLYQHYFVNKDLHFVYGTRDIFITSERAMLFKELLSKNQLDFQIHTFEGEHTVDREALLRLRDRVI
ncbi:MAG: phospholipase [Saprospiraceae bacterium]|nr:phospholipase [Saprospiraceae bacterium]